MDKVSLNKKRFNNLYSNNPNVEMLKDDGWCYLLKFYGRIELVIFSPKGWTFR